MKFKVIKDNYENWQIKDENDRLWFVAQEPLAYAKAKLTVEALNLFDAKELCALKISPD